MLENEKVAGFPIPPSFPVLPLAGSENVFLLEELVVKLTMEY